MPRSVFFIVALLIVYGSLYPFDFGAAPPLAWERFLASWSHITGRGDVLGNILLFVPFGYLGVLSFGRRAWLVPAAVLLAAGVQVLQVYLPGRDANLQDVIWNMLGHFIGSGLARLPWMQPAPGDARRAGLDVPFLLVACWVAYRLMPFVPSIDWQLWKDSLKPLLLHPQLSAVRVLHDAVAWAVVAWLWPRVWRRPRPLPALVALVFIVFSLEVVIVQNSLSAGNVLGAVLGLTLWQFWLSRRVDGTVGLALLLMASLLLSGLAPFQWREVPGGFHWLPFHGFLGGSMLINAGVLLEKGFFFGALVYLLWRQSGRLGFATVSTALLALGIELGQLLVEGHTAEITDPLFVLLIALALRAVAGEDSPVRRGAG